MEDQQSSPSHAATSILDEGRLYQYRERLQLEQNLPLGLVGGLCATFVGALLWASITVSTNLQFGYMAVGVGFLIGYTVRYFGKGMDTTFGIAGAILALIGCLLGNLFTLIGFIANDEGLGYIQVLLGIDYSLVPEAIIASFSPIDLLFYGIAVYEGYYFSFRHITEEEILANAAR
jgi:hypothetical protein